MSQANFKTIFTAGSVAARQPHLTLTRRARALALLASLVLTTFILAVNLMLAAGYAGGAGV